MIINYPLLKLSEAFTRLAREQPALDFSVDTPSVRAAEARVNEAYAGYFQTWRVTDKDVMEAWRAWVRVVEAAQPDKQLRLVS